MSVKKNTISVIFTEEELQAIRQAFDTLELSVLPHQVFGTTGLHETARAARAKVKLAQDQLRRKNAE